MEPVKNIVSRNIKHLRSVKGVTQEAVAAAVGIDPVTFRYYEYGKRFPKPEILDRLAEYFGTPQSVFFQSEEALEEVAASIPSATSDLSGIFQTLAKHPEIVELMAEVDEGFLDTIKGMLEDRITRNQSKDKGRAQQA